MPVKLFDSLRVSSETPVDRGEDSSKKLYILGEELGSFDFVQKKVRSISDPGFIPPFYGKIPRIEFVDSLRTLSVQFEADDFRDRVFGIVVPVDFSCYSQRVKEVLDFIDCIFSCEKGGDRVIDRYSDLSKGNPKSMESLASILGMSADKYIRRAAIFNNTLQKVWQRFALVGAEEADFKVDENIHSMLNKWNPFLFEGEDKGALSHRFFREKKVHGSLLSGNDECWKDVLFRLVFYQ